MYLQTLDTLNVDSMESNFTLEQLNGGFHEDYIKYFADKFYNTAAKIVNSYNTQTVFLKDHFSNLVYVSKYDIKTTISKDFNTNTLY